jgi:transposase-like protein
MVKHKVCTPDEKREICKLYSESGMTMKEVAQQYQISEKSVQRFLKEGKTTGFQKHVSFNKNPTITYSKSNKQNQLANDFVDSTMRNRDSITGEPITSQNYIVSKSTAISKPSTTQTYSRVKLPVAPLVNPIISQKEKREMEESVRRGNEQLKRASLKK